MKTVDEIMQKFAGIPRSPEYLQGVRNGILCEMFGATAQDDGRRVMYRSRSTYETGTAQDDAYRYGFENGIQHARRLKEEQTENE